MVREVDSYDRRLKRLKDAPRFVLINNYKCGFSSSNLLAYEKVTHISPQDKVIFFYRNIFLRSIGVFINWSITDDRYLRRKGWLLRNLERELGASDYSDLLSLFHDHRYGEAFSIYVEALETISGSSNHTLPQVEIIKYYGIERIDYFVELENSGGFCDITKIPFPWDRTNQSDADVKQALTQCLTGDPSMQSRLRRIYREDIDYFSSIGLVCDRWPPSVTD